MLLIIYMAICGGYAGGSLPYSHLLDKEVSIIGKKINFTWLTELLFCITFAFVPQHVADAPFALVWSYLWMQSATAPALHWGQGGYNPDRTSTLKPLVDWINEKTIEQPHSSVEYCRLYMFIRSMLICLPAGPSAAIAGATLWTLAYEGGARFKWHHGVTECLAGASGAIAILIWM